MGKHLTKPGTPGYQGDPEIKVDTGRVRARIEDIRDGVYQAAITGAIKIGQELAWVRRALPYGEWMKFLASLDMPARTAQYNIALSDEFGHLDTLPAFPVRRAKELLPLFAAGEISELTADGILYLDTGEKLSLEQVGALSGGEFDAFIDKLKDKMMRDQRDRDRAVQDLDRVKASHRKETDLLRTQKEQLEREKRALEGDPFAVVATCVKACEEVIAELAWVANRTDLTWEQLQQVSGAIVKVDRQWTGYKLKIARALESREWVEFPAGTAPNIHAVG